MKIAIILSIIFQALIFCIAWLCVSILNQTVLLAYFEKIVIFTYPLILFVHVKVLINYIIIDREVKKYLDNRKSVLVNWR